MVLATSLMGCSTQSQVESKPQVVKKVYVAKKHCHTFKGYGWAKRVCHAHPAPHKHSKPRPKYRKPKYAPRHPRSNYRRPCPVCPNTKKYYG